MTTNRCLAAVCSIPMMAIDLIMRLETEFRVDFSKLDFDVSLIDTIQAISSLAGGGGTDLRNAAA